MIDIYKIIDGRKYMWDGNEYIEKSSASENILNYGNNGFDTRLFEEDGKFLIYTRRVVVDVKVEGESLND